MVADIHSREAASLPFYTRVEPPASYSVIEKPSKVTVEVEQGRHPALPKESWEVVNAAHFKAYKAQIARHWPPSPALACPYPSPPDIEDEEGWRAYIDGADGGDEHDEEEDEEMDEEAAMNAPPKPARPRERREPLVSLLAGLDTVSTSPHAVLLRCGGSLAGAMPEADIRTTRSHSWATSTPG